MVDEATFERLAALEHDRWSGWMKYMIANLTLENLTRWLRQMETPYRDLSEREKESDRKEVRRALEILGADVRESPEMKSIWVAIDAETNRDLETVMLSRKATREEVAREALRQWLRDEAYGCDD